MKHDSKLSAWWLVGVAAFAAGCSLDASEAEPAAADAATGAAPPVTAGEHQRILARLELGPQTAVTFVATEIDGELAGIDVVEQFSMNAGPPLAKPSLADATYLDLFRAISDAEAPAELVKNHLDSGHDLDKLRPLSFGRTTLLASSYSTTRCTEFVLDGYPNNRLIKNNLNTLPTGTDWAVSPGDNVQWPDGTGVYEAYSMGACGDSAAVTASTKFRSRRIGTSTWNTVDNGQVYVAMGTGWRIRGGPAQGFERQPSIKGLGMDHHIRGGVGSFANIP